MQNSKEIKIIGAGPAGFAAAINLAMNTYKVTVYEKDADVGMRFHNDFQGLENWSTEEDVLASFKKMSIRTDFFNKPFYGGWLYGPSEKAQIESADPMFYLIKRGKDPDSLDNSLKKQALDLGVNIVFNTRADIKDGDIIATGPRRPDVFAFGIVFEINIKDTAIVILSDTIAPKGYSYLLVSDKEATLATVIFKQFKLGNQYLEKTIEKFRDILNFEINNPKKFVGFGNFFIPRSAIKEGKIYVGEAAGFQDFLFGFGIRYAITSGYLAAKSIIERVNYDTLWRDKFGQQLRASKANRTFYELFGKTAYNFLVKKTGISKDPRKVWTKFYNTSILRSLVKL
ncbi:MAG: NAD(P)-binding protein [Thermodesulfovibrionales bacterium]|nr:NAD(P)-binding protein [Thermodesulfovibrionales bacterium]